MSEIKEQIKALKLEEKRRQKLQQNNTKCKAKFDKMYKENDIEMTIWMWKKMDITIIQDPERVYGKLKNLGFTIDRIIKRSNPEKRFLEREEFLTFAILLEFPEEIIGKFGEFWDKKNPYNKNITCNICMEDKCETEMGEFRIPNPAENPKYIKACKCEYEICMDCCGKVGGNCPFCRTQVKFRGYKIN
jgi:hypothetical protein